MDNGRETMRNRVLIDWSDARISACSANWGVDDISRETDGYNLKEDEYKTQGTV
jgi:hypothetical protein